MLITIISIISMPLRLRPTLLWGDWWAIKCKVAGIIIIIVNNIIKTIVIIIIIIIIIAGIVRLCCFLLQTNFPNSKYFIHFIHFILFVHFFYTIHFPCTFHTHLIHWLHLTCSDAPLPTSRRHGRTWLRASEGFACLLAFFLAWLSCPSCLKLHLSPFEMPV